MRYIKGKKVKGMNKLKKYREHLNESHTGEISYEANLDRKNGNCTLDIDNPPASWESPYVYGGRVEWILDVSHKSSGMQINGARLVYVLFHFDYQDPETGDTAPDEVEIEIDGRDIDFERIESQIGKPDYYLNLIEIDMKGSKDPKDWSYTLDIGN
jgi:hypothetical protein